MSIDYCGVCDRGSKRAINQDAVLMSVKDNMGLFVVADGMGGHLMGEAASGSIIKGLDAWWTKVINSDEDLDFSQMVQSLETEIKIINHNIFAQYNANAICGSTLVALLIHIRQYCIFSVGDSRIYRLRRLHMDQLTTDDVWENQKEIREALEWEEIQKHHNFGKLTCAVGIKKDIVLEIQMGDLKKGDKFLLCSDGVHKICENNELKAWMKRYRGERNGKAILERLSNQVYQMGAPDNFSAIFLRWLW